jgi:hypothetical protein
MKGQAKLLPAVLFFTLFLSSPESKITAGQTTPPRECSAVDKGRPPLFISFERVDNKAWDGGKYVKGVLLRMRNNSGCAILLEAPPGEASPWRVRDGKLIRLETSEAKDGERLSLKYLMKYPGREVMVLGGFGGDVLESVRLRGGDSVLFSVPLRNFKQKGRAALPYTFEGAEAAGASAENYLRFEPQLLPGKFLR